MTCAPVRMAPRLTAAWREENRLHLAAALSSLRLTLEAHVRFVVSTRPDMAPLDSRVVLLEQVNSWLRDRAAERARFFETDAEARALFVARGIREQELQSRRKSCEALGAAPALDDLTHLFALSAADRFVLLLAYAPEHDPAFDRLFAFLSDEPSRRWPTPSLATLLYADATDAAALAASFSEQCRLRRFDLVHLEEEPGAPHSAARLRLDPRIIAFLSGSDAIDRRVTFHMTAPAPALPLPPEHAAQRDRVATYLASAAQEGHRPFVNVVSQGDGEASIFVRAAYAQLGLGMVPLDAQAIWPSTLARSDAESALDALLSLTEREALLSGSGVFLDLTGLSQEELHRAPRVAALLAQKVVPTVIVTQEPLRMSDPSLVVRLVEVGAAARVAQWRAALGSSARAVDVANVVEQFSFGPAAMARAVAGARARALGRTLDTSDVWEACRDVAGADLGELGQRLILSCSWEDIVVPDDVREQLRALYAQVRSRAEVYDVWQLRRKLHRGQGIAALFAGPSGTGKTLAAEVLASALSLDLYRVDLAGVVSKYVGETERNLRRVFEAAERSGAVLFFDEADALFGKRTDVKDSHDRYANIEVNYLLQRMEEHKGLAILATNKKTALDRAFLRRLRYVLDFPFPDAPLRKRIWQRIFPEATPREGLDYDMLALLELTGGNIKSIAVNAAFRAADLGSPIRMEHVAWAARWEYKKLEKTFPDHLTHAPHNGEVSHAPASPRA